ncbi:YciI family protein [Nonomuraea rhizosphaerae]|uniref:YciI family protein n=1 Tax=Nonomuraea rhizosphaerae TaxID=2665663 RepID=UPI001C6002CA|nr:YciI family protein [Nonomuraea rhizosphaerae]
MKFMIVGKSNAEVEAGALPEPGIVEAMHEYNATLARAGVLLAAEGLYPSSAGAQIAYDKDGRATVLDGPFAEAKELIAGFWLIQVKSREEALEWAMRVPVPRGGYEGVGLDVWRVYDASDAADESVPPEAFERTLHERLRGDDH